MGFFIFGLIFMKYILKNVYNFILIISFWRYGEWYDVVIDDRLPFWTNGNLVYSSNRDLFDDYWGPLLVNITNQLIIINNFNEFFFSNLGKSLCKV